MIPTKQAESVPSLKKKKKTESVPTKESKQSVRLQYRRQADKSQRATLPDSVTSTT